MYDFKDNKTTGTVTVTKVWDDGLTNDEREIPDIKISTKKPSKSALGYTVTFHGNGLKFADNSETNEIVLNSSGQIVSGMFKVPGNTGAAAAISWYSDKACKNRIEVSDDGVPQMTVTGDLDLWAKEMTFEIKGYEGFPIYKNGFNQSIPSTVTEVIFTDEIKPAAAEVIDVDADGDDGVVAWTENDGTVMKVSSQIKDIEVQAAVNSRSMFSGKDKIKKIDFKMLNTSNVTDMRAIFSYCIGLTSLNLTPIDTLNVTDMGAMFSNCRSLTSFDLTPLDTSKVTDMSWMFSGCSGLTSLDLTPLNTSNVMYMDNMFYGCSHLASLDLIPLDTSKVTNMNNMFCHCSGLTSLDLTPLDTLNVMSMDSMFAYSANLKELDCSKMNAKNVTSAVDMFSNCSSLNQLRLPLFSEKLKEINSFTNIGLNGNTEYAYGMFDDCRNLTSLDLTPLDTSNVTYMGDMFRNCMGLISLDLTGWDTSNVTDMNNMFCNCRGLTSITTGPNFKFVGTNYSLSGTWRNTAGETFTEGTFPSNVADTYTKISN